MKLDNPSLEERKTAILVAAERVFSECGYAATTMEAVAERAGISKGNIYNYFQNKQDLFQHVFARSFTLYEKDFLDVLSSPGPATQRLERFLDFWFGRLAYYQQIGRLVLECWATAARQEGSGKISRSLAETYALWRARLADLLAEGVRAGEFSPDADPNVGATMILAILNGIEVECILDIGLVVDGPFMAALKQGLLGGLKAATAPARHERIREGKSHEFGRADSPA
ncbi:MAG: TetR/AcrR family transcriptional regulator [Phycisphaerae bacterium]